MEFFFGLFLVAVLFYVLYVVVRKAVAAGIRDADESRREDVEVRNEAGTLGERP
ncbi:hypothetical protein [Cryobacterium melibiosiphilum]|uniref:hypothetical protein n=1 Tax=Cryobacterium melibiosiphilum TaxID=995039 RepID=UPI001314A23C|nr:hypothetical protein [Cryobacterium melibiosiphilum]